MTSPAARREPLADDGITARWVVLVALATLAVMACAVLVAHELARGGAPRAATRSGAPPEDIDAIEMTLLPASGSARAKGSGGIGPARDALMFSEQRRSDSSAEAQLSSYGWADRGQGTVRIPLARARELYLEREAQRAGAAPGARRGAPKGAR